MSVNETAMQNVWRHYFLLPGALSEGTIWPQVVGIATLQEFYKKFRFLTAPLWHIILESFHTFDLKYHRKSEFNKKTSSKNDDRLNA
jgi:hypothetical protein